MVMVCTLVPVGLAEGEEIPVPTNPSEISWDKVAVGHTHSSNSGRITEAATCTKPGYGACICSVNVEENGKQVPCGATGTFTIPATGHTWGTDGVCTVCREKQTVAVGLNKTTLSLAVNGSETLTATVTPADAVNRNVTWSSSDPTVATVDETGKVTAQKAGTATITATSAFDTTKTASCTVTVSDTYTVTFNYANLPVTVGGTQALYVTMIRDSAGTSVDFKDATYVWTSANTSIATVVGQTGTASTATVTGIKAGTTSVSVVITLANGTKINASIPVTVTDRLSIVAYANNTNSATANRFTAMNQSITLQARMDSNVVDTSQYSITWTISNTSSNDYTYFTSTSTDNHSSTFTVAPYMSSATLRTCTVVATVTPIGSTTPVYTASYPLYLQIDGGINLTATVNDEYYLGDVSNAGGYSVADQLTNALRSIYGSNRVLNYVIFENVTTNYGKLDNITTNTTVYASEFGNVKFVPTAKGSAVFRFTAYSNITGSYYQNEAQSGVLTITVTDTISGGDVIFYGSVGQDVYLDSAEFDDFWDSKFPGGILDYVTFGSVSSGSLLDADGKAAGSTKFYAVPSRTQYDLDDVHYRPASSNTGTTVTFTFTASGENRNRQAVTASGRVNIVFMSKSPSDIKYTVGSDNTVNLKASDFTAAYKEATGSNAPNNFKIELQNIPNSGSLSYTDSSKKNSSTVSLTSSNIRSRQYTASSSGTNQINDVKYTASGSATATVEYVAYAGNTPKFKGTISFGPAAAPTDIVVTFQSTNGQAAQFSWTEFTSKSSALANASKLRFSAPSYGTLYLNGAAITASTDVLNTQVSGISYVPRTGSNNQERLAFTASNSSGTVVGSGTVVINVTGNATTTPPSGITSASQFKDVKTNGWYYTYVDELVRKGIVAGRGDGTFDPDGTLNYGEALKLVLEATGHTAAVGTGNDWAINYKNLAVSNGWISNDISLTAPISRLATAELIARVLGLSQRTGDSPFADTTNGYAAALYYTTPQIIVGNPNPNGGKPLFNNSTRTTLTRAEICTIVCRLYNYNQGGNNSGTTVTTNPSTGLPAGI